MNRLIGWAFAGTMLGASGGAVATPIYIGSFNVFDGPSWQTAPVPLSARQTAALLFGGEALDYAISIDPTVITHTAWLDGVGDLQYLLTAAPEDFVQAPGSGLYDDILAYSAWVCDHADCMADGYLVNEGWAGFNYTNYVWKLNVTDPNPNPVPVPSTVALLLGAAFIYRLRKT